MKWILRQKSQPVLVIHCLLVKSRGPTKLAMCRTRVVGSVAAQTGTETDESSPSAGVVASAEPWATADFALQLTCLLLWLFFLAAVSYYAYRRRQEIQKSYRNFSTQTDQEIGTREELDRVIRSVSTLQNQVLTMELERDSERRLAQLRRSRSVSHEYLHENEVYESAGFNAVPQ